MKLVADWKQAWTWTSMHAMTAAVAVQGTWMALPEDLKARVPAPIVTGLTLGLLAFGIVGRLRDQAKPPKGEPHV